jgi:DNA-binding transcriptional regulator PaaX
MARSLLPFPWIGAPWNGEGILPWLHAGDATAWKRGITATGGLVLNGVAAAGALAVFQSTTLNLTQGDGVSHQTARSNLQKLAACGLLIAGKEGRREIFRVPRDLAARLAEQERSLAGGNPISP